MPAPGSAADADDVAPPARWRALVIALVVVLLVFAGWLVSSDSGPVPPFLGAPAPMSGRPPPEAPYDLLDLAGSGSNLPITRALAAVSPEPPENQPVVHDSIGSGSGIRALLDGAVDLALVSRPLAPTERELGLVEIPYARVPIIVAVNALVPDMDLQPHELSAIYAGERTTWSDGTEIVVLMRERGDSSHRAVSAALPGFAAISDRAWKDDRFRVLYHDDDMREAIAATPGAVGLFGQGAIPAGEPIRGLRISGVEPSPQSVRSGRYPYAKDLLFVSRGAPQGAAASFVTFAHSEAGRAAIERMGAIPLPEVEP